MSDTRHFWYWCGNCPTRVSIDTEVACGTTGEEPEYCAGDGVGMVSVRAPSATDDGMERAYLCPACGEQLDDLDDLTARGLVPYHEESKTPEVHAEWLTKARYKG